MGIWILILSNLSKMDVTCDGHSVYGKPFEPRFEK